MFALMANNPDEMVVNWDRHLMIQQNDVIGLEKYQIGENNMWSKLFKLIFISSIFFFLFISAEWYKDRLTDKQLDELENPPTTTRPRVKGSRRKPSRKQQRTEPVEEANEE